MIWQSLVFCAIILFSFWLWNVYNAMKKDRNFDKPLPPGWFGIPLFGETLSLLKQGSYFYDSKLKQHGKIYKTHLFGNPTIRVIGEDNVLYILSRENDLVSSHWPKSTQVLLDGGLVLESSGPTHTLRKKMVNKAFTHQALDRYIPELVATCRLYINTWCQKKRVLLYPELKKLTFHIASKTLAGFHLTQNDVDASMNLFQDFVNGMFSIPVKFPFGSFLKAVSARTKLMEQIEAQLRTSEDASSPNILTFLRSLSESGSLGREALRNICLDLLFASHETTTSATCFLLLYLYKHKNVLPKLQEELHQTGTFDKAKDDKLSFDSINCLKYLRNVVKETIRCSCPIGAGFRKVLKTFSLQGYQIPKGWLLAYSIRETQLTSDVFDSPREFDPDRWTNDDEISRNFLCFGGGKRRCVGKDFSMLFMKIFIIEMLRMCDWRVEDSNPKLINFPSPQPCGGMPVSFRRKP